MTIIAISNPFAKFTIYATVQMIFENKVTLNYFCIIDITIITVMIIKIQISLLTDAYSNNMHLV
jgi:hypothetical protein